jgi:hypothetical protein
MSKSGPLTTSIAYDTGSIYSPPNSAGGYTDKVSIYGGSSPSQEIYAVKSTPGSRFASGFICKK